MGEVRDGGYMEWGNLGFSSDDSARYAKGEDGDK